jgi:hypothetical protein
MNGDSHSAIQRLGQLLGFLTAYLVLFAAQT